MLLFPVGQNSTRNRVFCFQCTLVLCTRKCAANSMAGMSPSRWHFGRCCRCSEGQKHVFLLSQFQRECKTEKGVQRCVVTGLTPAENSDTLLLWELQPCLLKRLSPNTNTPGQPFNCRMDSACWGKPRFQWRKTAQVFKRSKIIFFSEI